MYITPAIQDFQLIHPAVYLRAADPAGPVCVVDKLPIHIYSYRSPPGLFLYLKAKGCRAADPCLFQFTDTDIVEFQEYCKGIVTSCGVRVFIRRKALCDPVAGIIIIIYCKNYYFARKQERLFDTKRYRTLSSPRTQDPEGFPACLFVKRTAICFHCRVEIRLPQSHWL